MYHSYLFQNKNLFLSCYSIIFFWRS